MTVTLLCALLITSITACSNEAIMPPVTDVPQKCKTAMPERPVVDNGYCNDDRCTAVKTTSNYNAVREWGLELEATLKSCL